MALNFKVAAEASAPGADEAVVEVPLGDQTFYARRPTAAQTALLVAATNARTETEQANAIFNLIEGLMGPEALDVIKDMVWARRLDLDDLVGGSEMNPDGGLLDQIFSEFSGRPTEPSTGSATSRTSGGRRSTGRSPGKGSTRSNSPSTDS